MQAIIHLYYAFFSEPFSAEKFAYYLSRLPVAEQEKIRRYKRWEDAQASLLGKVLLLKGLGDLGFPQSELKYTEFKRPYMDGPFDFNIAHSGNYVICALSQNCRVGVDVEQIKPVNYEDYANVFSKRENEVIAQSESQSLDFFHTWTRKEALIKADGAGLYLNLEQIDVCEDIVALNGVLWHLQGIDIHPGYALHICSGKVAKIALMPFVV